MSCFGGRGCTEIGAFPKGRAITLTRVHRAAACGEFVRPGKRGPVTSPPSRPTPRRPAARFLFWFDWGGSMHCITCPSTPPVEVWRHVFPSSCCFLRSPSPCVSSALVCACFRLLACELGQPDGAHGDERHARSLYPRRCCTCVRRRRPQRQGASDFRLRVAGSAIYTPTTVRACACSYTDRLAARYTPFYTRAGGLLVRRSRISRHAFIAANVWAGVVVPCAPQRRFPHCSARPL